IWGYAIYQTLIAAFLYLGHLFYKPYKVKYDFKKEVFIEMVKIGMPMYVWNYLTIISRSVPRLLLVLFGGPLLVGLYSPAGSLNNALLSLPTYVNSYMFPKMSQALGKTGDKRK